VVAGIKERGARRRLVGIRCSDKGVPRDGYGVSVSGERVGEVTSGNFSPSLKTGIAMGYVDARVELEVGEEVSIDARGRPIAGVIVKPPFIER
jgi:aminomethyltransferase